MVHGIASTCTVLVLGLGSSTATAGPAAAEAQASSDDPGGEAAARRDTPSERKQDPWIRRWAPEPNMFELGVYGGVLLPSTRLELFEADFALPDQGFRPLRRPAPDLGLRLGYFPVRFFGIEVEGGAMPARTDDDQPALLWTLRGHVVGQLGLWSVTPFVLAGGGLLSVASEREAVGDDTDASLHLGGGVKVYLTRYAQLRVDVRDIVAARRGYNAGVSHSLEALLGLSVTFGRAREQPAPPPPGDRDADGILDPDDRCLDQPGVVDYHGCPIPDSDGDGILDPDDQCLDQPGVADYHGCPIPDSDGDGILDPDDQCLDQPGVADYRGCPIPDSDGDGLLDPDDRCADEPENRNGFQDEDGCPDEIPKEVARFTGVIEGIFFDRGKATIRSKSRPTLNKAVEVLTSFPSIKVEITGHTDNRGGRERNLQLSQRRAESVKQYLVDKGVAAERISTRGMGPDEPVASNKTGKGRQKNRRIEFTLVSQ